MTHFSKVVNFIALSLSLTVEFNFQNCLEFYIDVLWCEALRYNFTWIPDDQLVGFIISSKIETSSKIFTIFISVSMSDYESFGINSLLDFYITNMSIDAVKNSFMEGSKQIILKVIERFPILTNNAIICGA